MNAAGRDGSLSRKALKFETAASELFFQRGGSKWLVDSTFFILWYFLKETPAFIIFLLILGIPSSHFSSVTGINYSARVSKY